MIDASYSRYKTGFRNNKPRKVIIAMMTLAAFIFNTISFDLALLRPLDFVGQAWADGTPSELTSVGSDRAALRQAQDSPEPGRRTVSPVSPGVIKDLKVGTFALPEYLGHVRDSWSADIDRRPQTIDHRPPVVIHIQDAHCNYDAQKRVAEILEYINKNYGVNTINLEGGAKEYDLSIFTNIGNKDIREKTSDYFVKEGLVNGAEYFAINNPEKVSLWGIEDTALYIDNLNVYRSSLQHKDEIEKSLKALSHIMANLKIKIYSKDLLDFDAKYSQYKANNIEFKEYLDYLLEAAKRRAVDIKAYKNITLLDRALQEESAIDFKKANIERDRLVELLEKKLSKNAMAELVAKTVEFKAERISQKSFYAYLIDRAKKMRLDMKDSSELLKYMDYIELYDAMDKMKIMEELDDLETKIKLVMFENDSQKDLARLSKNLALLKNIFNISLTRDDYRYYKANEDAFALCNFTRFIEREAPLVLHSSLRANEVSEAISKSGLDQYRDEISKFYEYSFKRDDAFLKNMRVTIDQRPQTIDRRPKGGATILVTGGFHTDNLCDIFRKQGISYISIIPNFRNPQGYQSPYFGILSGKQSIMDSRLVTLFSSSLATASLLNRLGLEADRRLFDIAVRLEEMVLEKIGSNEGVVIHNGETGDAQIRFVIDRELNIIANYSNKANLPGIDVKILINELSARTITASAAPAPIDASVEKEIREVLGKYPISHSANIYPASGGRGQQGRPFIVETDQGKYVLKPQNTALYSNLVDSMLYEVSVVNKLKESGIPVAGIIKTIKGSSFVISDEGKKGYMLYEFVEGALGADIIKVNGELNDAQYKNAIYVLARMHKVLRGFHPDGGRLRREINDFKDVQQKLKTLKDSLQNKKKSRSIKMTKSENFFLDNVDFILEQINILNHNLRPEVYQKLTRTNVNGDYHPGNIIFRGDEVAGVFDWDHLREGPEIYGFFNGILHARMLKSPIDIDALYEALYETVQLYEKIAPISEADRENLLEIMRLKFLDMATWMVRIDKLSERDQVNLSDVLPLEQTLALMDRHEGVFVWMEQNLKNLRDSDALIKSKIEIKAIVDKLMLDVPYLVPKENTEADIVRRAQIYANMFIVFRDEVLKMEIIGKSAVIRRLLSDARLNQGLKAYDYLVEFFSIITGNKPYSTGGEVTEYKDEIDINIRKLSDAIDANLTDENMKASLVLKSPAIAVMMAALVTAADTEAAAAKAASATTPPPVGPASKKSAKSVIIRSTYTVLEGAVEVWRFDESGKRIEPSKIIYDEIGNNIETVTGVVGQKTVIYAHPRMDGNYAPGKYRVTTDSKEGALRVHLRGQDGEITGDPHYLYDGESIEIDGEIYPTVEIENIAVEEYQKALAAKTAVTGAVPGSFSPTKYIQDVSAKATEVMKNTNAQDEPIYIFIPLNLSNVEPGIIQADMQPALKTAKEMLRKKYEFGKINVIFYKGTVKDLNTRLDKENRRLESVGGVKINPLNTVVYMGSKEIGDNPAVAAENLRVTLVKESAPQEGNGYFSVGGHAILAIGILKLRNEGEESDSSYWEHVRDLAQALTNNPSVFNNLSRDGLIDMLKSGNFEIVLPPIKAINTDAIKDLYKAEEASMKSV